jgi:hypothetical protein
VGEENENMSAALTSPPKVPNLPSWCKRTIVGLTIVGKPTVQQWLDAFETLDKTGKGHQWWIGDHLNQGEELYPEEWAQAIDPVEEQKRENEGKGETYRQYKQVAFRIDAGRRRPNLYFGHHHAVAYMEVEEQEHWLELAIEENLSVDKLRKKIRKSKVGGSENDPALDLMVLQEPAIRQWLDDYRAMVSAHDDALESLIKENEDLKGARFLHRMTLTHINHTVRQLERTNAIDCGVIKKALGYLITGTIEVIGRAMRNRGFFMSDADLNERLNLLVQLGEVTKKKAEELRHDGAKGDVVYQYKLVKAGQMDKDSDAEWI